MTHSNLDNPFFTLTSEIFNVIPIGGNSEKIQS